MTIIGYQQTPLLHILRTGLTRDAKAGDTTSRGGERVTAHYVDGATRGRHHCRVCGQGFCEQCSQQRMPVPSRGWLHPVHVCDDCAKMETL